MYYKSPKLAIFLPFSVILRTFLGQNEKHDKFNCYLCALDSGGKSGQDAPTRLPGNEAIGKRPLALNNQKGEEVALAHTHVVNGQLSAAHCLLSIDNYKYLLHIPWVYYKTSLQNTMCHNNLWPKAYTPISVR
ncbi:MAG TPA: hypothetical protein H9785_10575 [Candidatus Bacteroides intestinavium]|uniref:Uncharacterized protein n=1 Tax=Candidatus Bacteroides intestinavium TaxID=2838469 RepID=A0A9D2HTL8_9BACE|nr:hypothetical protein [Candidatus Bacteroides intestinavium]